MAVLVDVLVLRGLPSLVPAPEAPYSRDLRDVAAWVDVNTPPDVTVLVHDAGAISVLANRRLVDLVGLKTPSSIEAHTAHTWPSCGRHRDAALDTIARTADANYFIVVEDWKRGFRLVDGLRGYGWRLTLVREDAPGVNGFNVYRLQAADAAAAGTSGTPVALEPRRGAASSPTMSASVTIERAAPHQTAFGR